MNSVKFEIEIIPILLSSESCGLRDLEIEEKRRWFRKKKSQGFRKIV